MVDPSLCPSLHAVPSSLLSQQSHHHQPKSSRASHIPPHASSPHPHPLNWGPTLLHPDLTSHHCAPSFGCSSPSGLAHPASVHLIPTSRLCPVPSARKAQFPAWPASHCRNTSPTAGRLVRVPGTHIWVQNHHSRRTRPESAPGASMGLHRGGVHCQIHPFN